MALLASMTGPMMRPLQAVQSTVHMTVTGSDFCFGLPGSIPPCKQWDPWGILDGKLYIPWAQASGKALDKYEVFRLREAELVHGRVAMLAALGFIVQEYYHPFFEPGPAGDVIATLPKEFGAAMLVLLYPSHKAEQERGARLFDREAFELETNPVPGDWGFDPLGIKPSDPADFRRMQEREISNGRLAMFAAAGFLAQEGVTGETWSNWWHPYDLF